MAELATVRVSVNTGCYITTPDGHAVGGQFKPIKLPDGRTVQAWIGEEFWATPADVKKWTMLPDGRAMDRPLVTVLGLRSAAFALSEAGGVAALKQALAEGHPLEPAKRAETT